MTQGLLAPFGITRPSTMAAPGCHLHTSLHFPAIALAWDLRIYILFPVLNEEVESWVLGFGRSYRGSICWIVG
jgi:hypothetical protein